MDISTAATTTDATAATTPANEGSRRLPAVSRVRRLGAAAIAALLAVPLLMLGVPRLLASVAVLPYKSTVDAVKLRQPVSQAALERAWDGLGDAPFAHLYPDIAIDRSLVGLYLLSQPGLPAERIAELRTAAIATLRGALAVQPLGPFAWFRLATLEMTAPADPQAALVALRMATTLAVYEPRLLFSRLDLWLTLWNEMSAEDAALVERQLVLAWTSDPAALSRLAQHHHVLYAVRSALERTLPEPESLDSHFPVLVRRH